MAVVDTAAGNLQAIADRQTRDELRKLWAVVNARNGQVGAADNRYVTLGELDAAKRALIAKIPKETTLRQFRQDVNAGAGEGGNSGLLASNNRWTGKQNWSHTSVKAAPPYRFADMGTYDLVVGAPGSILLDDNYNTLIDVRRVTDQTGLATGPSWGGTAAIYIQHRIFGPTINPTVNCGIRVQVQTSQSGPQANDMVGGYFGVYNAGGVNVGMFGVHVDAYHKGDANSITYGLSTELFREYLAGKVVGCHIRVVTGGLVASQWADTAYLASPSPGGSIGFDTVFQAGSDYTGFLQCRYGLDVSYASCDVGAVVLKPGQKILLNGRFPQPAVGLTFDPQGKIQFFADRGNTFGFGNEGTLFLDRPRTFSSATAPAGGVPMGNPMGFVEIWLGGYPRLLPFFQKPGT